MSNDWRGINDLYYTTGASAPHKKPVPGPGLDDDGCAAEKKQEPQVRLSDPRFIKPVGGYRPGKPCRLSVRVEPLVEKPRKRVLFDVYSSYNGRPEIREYVRLSGFIEDTGDAVAEMMYLPLNEHYANDREKPPDAAYGIRFEAYHAAGGAPVSSETLRLPCPEEPLPDLRRGHYDDTGAQRYGKPREGEDYVPGEAVKALQQDLSTLRFLPKGPADGFFGDTTDAAVREFQEYAIAAFRLPLGKGKLITTDSRLAQSSPDGIVGRKTRDEIDLWKEKEWVKPALTLYHGDYDDQGVRSGHGMSGGEDHHGGAPVLDAQNNLQKIGAYAGALDGWFFDKMRDAVKLFQKYAVRGRFLINGQMTDIGEKLTGYDKGSLDAPTREMVAKVVEMGGKVPDEKPYGGYELKRGDNDKAKKWGGEVRTGEDGFVKELQKDLLRLGYWVSRPDNLTGKGMLCDGDLGQNTENAIKTFQLEYFVLDAQGNIDTSKKSTITGVVNADTAKKIKEKVKNIGNRKWDRPGRKPHAKWQEPAGTGAYTPNKEFKPEGVLFYQLPPSAGYYRRASVEYGSRTVLSRKTSWRCTPYKVFDDDDCAWLMADCWGTKEQIEVIKKIGDAWLTKDDGKARTVKDSSGKQRAVEPFGVGDISGFNGGAMACHAGHRDGNSTDLNRTDSNPICHTGVYTDAFHREETYELCKMLIAGGTNKIQFNCHHVIKNIEKAQELKDHHNHIHFDGPRSTGSAPMLANRFTTCGECGFYDKCEVKIKKAKDNGVFGSYSPNMVYNDTRGKGVIKLVDSE